MEHHLEKGDSETKSSHSKTATHLVVKRRCRALHQTIADIRQSRLNLKLWLLFTLFISAVLVLVNTLYGHSETGDGYCFADGSFQTAPIFPMDRLWTSSEFFQVNIAIGNLTFTQAKVADISWDLIVGRGGQAILSFITWKLFADYAALSMIIQPVTFATYRTLFAETGPSISSTARLVHDLIRYKGFASNLANAFIIYSMVFALVLPTLAGAATGYTPVNKAFIRDYDDSLVPFLSFQEKDSGDGWVWEYSNMTYQLNDIELRGSCVPVKDVSHIGKPEI
ncbi:hypothetical protein F4782DRAFT_531387 [Xylaria castorea]|nr:hypothetical protein F4782DRAFT_531387 [Xylaria castorea]